VNTPPKKAIKEFCIECCYDPLVAGGAVQQVAVCPATKCKLFHLRPMPRNCKKNGKPDLEAIAALKEELDRRDRGRDRQGELAF
jgi:hypothetical protein